MNTTRAYAINSYVVIDGATVRAVLTLYPDITHRVDIRICDVSVPMPARSDFANAAAARLKALVTSWLDVRRRYVKLTMKTRDQYKRAIGDVITLAAEGHPGESLRDYLLAEGFAVPYDGREINFEGLQKCQARVMKAVTQVQCRDYIAANFSDAEDAIDDGADDDAVKAYLRATGYLCEATDVEKEPGDDTLWLGLSEKGLQFFNNWCRGISSPPAVGVDSTSSVA
jgi:hypothetical protein